jgi:hypothetical protein
MQRLGAAALCGIPPGIAVPDWRFELRTVTPGPRRGRDRIGTVAMTAAAPTSVQCRKHCAGGRAAPTATRATGNLEEDDMSKITVLSDTDLDAVTGAGWGGGWNTNIVIGSGNGGTAITGVATGNIKGSWVSIYNSYTGDASANGNVTISN